MDGVLSDVEFYPYTRETAFQIVCSGLHILGTDVDRMWVKFRQNLGYGLVYERVDVYSVYILVVNDVQQVVQS